MVLSNSGRCVLLCPVPPPSSVSRPDPRLTDVDLLRKLKEKEKKKKKKAKKKKTIILRSRDSKSRLLTRQFRCQNPEIRSASLWTSSISDPRGEWTGRSNPLSTRLEPQRHRTDRGCASSRQAVKPPTPTYLDTLLLRQLTASNPPIFKNRGFTTAFTLIDPLGPVLRAVPDYFDLPVSLLISSSDCPPRLWPAPTQVLRIEGYTINLAWRSESHAFR